MRCSAFLYFLLVVAAMENGRALVWASPVLLVENELQADAKVQLLSVSKVQADTNSEIWCIIPPPKQGSLENVISVPLDDNIMHHTVSGTFWVHPDDNYYQLQSFPLFTNVTVESKEDSEIIWVQIKKTGLSLSCPSSGSAQALWSYGKLVTAQDLNLHHSSHKFIVQGISTYYFGDYKGLQHQQHFPHHLQLQQHYLHNTIMNLKQQIQHGHLLASESLVFCLQQLQQLNLPEDQQVSFLQILLQDYWQRYYHLQQPTPLHDLYLQNLQQQNLHQPIPLHDLYLQNLQQQNLHQPIPLHDLYLQNLQQQNLHQPIPLHDLYLQNLQQQNLHQPIPLHDLYPQNLQQQNHQQPTPQHPNLLPQDVEKNYLQKLIHQPHLSQNIRLSYVQQLFRHYWQRFHLQQPPLLPQTLLLHYLQHKLPLPLQIFYLQQLLRDNMQGFYLHQLQQPNLPVQLQNSCLYQLHLIQNDPQLLDVSLPVLHNNDLAQPAILP